MPITVEIDWNKNLSVIKIIGIVPFDDLCNSIIDYYKRGATGLIIVDLSGAVGHAKTYSLDRIANLANFLETVREGRDSGKTAFVAPDDLYFGICRTIEAFKGDSKIKYETFRSMDKAIEWVEGFEE